MEIGMSLLKSNTMGKLAWNLALLIVLVAPVALCLSGCGMVVEAGRRVLAARHYDRAYRAWVASNDAQARRERRHTLTLDPDHPEANLMMAQYYAKDHDWVRASACLKKINKSNKLFQSAGYLLAVADLYDKVGKLDLAEKSYREALRLHPFDPRTQNNFGYFLANHNIKLGEALPLIAKAVKAQPNQGAYVDSLGWVYYRLGRLDDAERELTRAHSLMPKSAEVHYHLGIVFRDKKQFDDARTEFSHACDLDSAFQPARDELLKLGEKLDSRNR